MRVGDVGDAEGAVECFCIVVRCLPQIAVVILLYLANIYPDLFQVVISERGVQLGTMFDGVAG